MRRILGERHQNSKNAVAAPKAASPVFEEWKAVHEVNRADIGNNGSFLEFGEEAVDDCLEADVNDENSNGNVLPANVPEITQKKPTTEKEAGFLSQEEYDVKEEIEGDGRSSIFSSDASDASSCENDQSEVESASMEIEFTADSCSTSLPSSEIIVVAAPVPLISITFTRERIGLTIGTRALWRVVKWSMLSALAIASYFYCPYLQYRVDKFIMQS